MLQRRGVSGRLPNGVFWCVSEEGATHTWRHSSGRGRRGLVCVFCSSGSAHMSISWLITTYAANSEHLEVGRAPRSAIDPLELNWQPARDRKVVVAGIVSGCRSCVLKFYPEEAGTRTVLVVGMGATRCDGGELYSLGRKADWTGDDGKVVAQQKSLGQGSFGGDPSELARPSKRVASAQSRLAQAQHRTATVALACRG